MKLIRERVQTWKVTRNGWQGPGVTLTINGHEFNLGDSAAAIAFDLGRVVTVPTSEQEQERAAMQFEADAEQSAVEVINEAKRANR